MLISGRPWGGIGQKTFLQGEDIHFCGGHRFRSTDPAIQLHATLDRRSSIDPPINAASQAARTPYSGSDYSATADTSVRALYDPGALLDDAHALV